MRYVEIMYQPGVKRIAICFSGQPRTWKKCVDTWHNILYHHDRTSHIDVFCHLWDFNTISNATEHADKSSELIPQQELDELITYLKPKKFMIESERTFLPMNLNQAITESSWLSQFYSTNRAATLKKQYEIENDFMYDVVVRSRYDSFYESKISDVYSLIKPNTMHGFHFGWESSTNRGRMGDICWIADSATHDLIADYYLNLGNIDKKWFNELVAEQVFFHYIKKNNINIQAYPWMIKLMRPSQKFSHSKSKDGYETW